MGHEDVAVGAHLRGIVHDAGGQLARPAHRQRGQRDRRRRRRSRPCRARPGLSVTSSSAAASSKTTSIPSCQAARAQITDFQWAGRSSRRRVPGSASSSSWSRLLVLATQLSSTRPGKFDAFGVRAVPGQPGGGGLAGTQGCHQFDCRDAHALILPRPPGVISRHKSLRDGLVPNRLPGSLEFPGIVTLGMTSKVVS